MRKPNFNLKPLAKKDFRKGFVIQQKKSISKKMIWSPWLQYLDIKGKVMVNGKKHLQLVTYFFVAKDDPSIHEECCLECEASKVIIILQVHMVPLDNKCCAWNPTEDRRNAMRKIYVQFWKSIDSHSSRCHIS